jgi:hypothetical protein
MLPLMPELRRDPCRAFRLVGVLLAMTAASLCARSEALPPFESLAVAGGEPVHKLLLGEPFTHGVMRTAEQENRDIEREETTTALTPVRYRVPVYWGNSNWPTNEKYVLQNSARLVKAIELLSRLPLIAENTRQWCQKTVDLVTKYRAQGEFYSPEHCRQRVIFGLTVHSMAPTLDAVFLSSVSPSASDTRVQTTLQYVCRQCQPIGTLTSEMGTYLFQVEAVVDLRAIKQPDVLSFALPLLLKN